MERLTQQLKDKQIHGNIQEPLAVYNQIYLEGRLAVPYHWHEHWEWIWLEKGELSFTIDEKKTIVKENEMVFISGRILHEIRSIAGIPSIHHALVFMPEIIESNYPDQVTSEIIKPLIQHKLDFKRIVDDKKDHKLIKIMKKIIDIDLSNDPQKYMEIKINILKMLSELCRQKLIIRTKATGQTDKRDDLYRAVSYIQQNFNKKINIDQLAGLSKLSKEYFIRSFKLKYDLTPVEYINNYRIYQAGKILKKGQQNVTEVALSCGFPNISYFILLFKKQFSVTPKKYQQKFNDKIIK